jgi:hypothetical protein
LLNVLLQIANKLGLSKKKSIIRRMKSRRKRWAGRVTAWGEVECRQGFGMKARRLNRMDLVISIRFRLDVTEL